MFHVELRQFPHNLCRFNLTEEQVRATVVAPWAREQWVELGERKWSPHQARLTVLEGPALPVAQLSMGRGWRNAQRQGQDVTERLLTDAREADATARAAGPDPGSSATDPSLGTSSMGNIQLLGDSLGLDLLSALGAEPAPLRQAWELADSRHPGRAPSESLALAELAVGSLLRAGLLVLCGDPREAGAPTPLGEHDAAQTLRAIDSWASQGTGTRVWMLRS